MTTYYVRKDRALDGSEGPPDESGFFYWFDGSDAAVTDPDAAWTDETNTDDSDITTVGYTTSTGTFETNEIFIEGTDAPGSGGTISSVYVVLYLGSGNVSTNAAVTVWTDGKGQGLGGHTFIGEQAGAWNVASTAISTPTGGWTWAKVQALEIAVYQNVGTDRLEVAAVGILVHTTTEGESTTDPYRTIDDAANSVAAGDTVYVGAGVYREQVVMDTSGTNGSEISFIADVDGVQTGDAGLVIISAYADETSAATRASCLDPNEKEFIIWRGFVMTGGTSGVVAETHANNVNYEGCVWEDCVFIQGHDDADQAILLYHNSATTPTNNGPTWRRCVFNGAGVRLMWDGNESADQDLKVTIESCVFTGTPNTGTGYAGVLWDYQTTGTYQSGGVTINNCLFDGKYYGVYADHGTSTTYPVEVTNSLFRHCFRGVYKQTSNDGALTSAYNTFASCQTPYSSVTTGTGDRENASDPGLLGGVGDYPLYRFWGWSPYRPFEPIRTQDDAYTHSVIGDGDTATASAFDLYNEDRPMGGRAGERVDTYYFDASDAGPTDNDAAWTNDANAFDGDEGTLADTTTPGTETTNELRGTGTTAPTTGGTIISAQWRGYGGTSTGAVLTAYCYHDTDLLDFFGVSVDDAWSPWYDLATPTGGWTWAKVAALEASVVLAAGGTVGEWGAFEVKVVSTPTGQDDRGAVEGRARPEVETTTVSDGTTSARFEGAGFHDFLIPVAAASTTVTVKAQFDASYTGTLPQLLLMNAPGLGEGTPDTVTTGSGTWDTLSINFTPTSAGIARVRIRSNDTSAAGECFFDTLAVS